MAGRSRAVPLAKLQFFASSDCSDTIILQPRAPLPILTYRSRCCLSLRARPDVPILQYRKGHAPKTSDNFGSDAANSAAEHGLGSSLFARRYWGNNYCSLFLRLLKCFTSAGALPTCAGSMRFTHWGFPIRTPPDHRLLATSPKFIAGTPRPSSLLKAKASTIRP